MSKRRALVSFSNEFLVETLRRVGVPKGAQVVDAKYDGFRDVIEMVIEHESYEELNEGDCVPPVFVERHGGIG